MDTKRYARILQNMIEEAEERLDMLDGAEKLIRGFAYKGPSPELAKRRAQLKEAMELEAELGGPLMAESIPEPAPAEQGEELAVIIEAADEVANHWRPSNNEARFEVNSANAERVLAYLRGLAARPQPKEPDNMFMTGPHGVVGVGIAQPKEPQAEASGELAQGCGACRHNHDASGDACVDCNPPHWPHFEHINYPGIPDTSAAWDLLEKLTSILNTRPDLMGDGVVACLPVDEAISLISKHDTALASRPAPTAEPSPGYYKMYLSEQARAERAEADEKALREALTPSEGTKAAYIGEFEFPVKAYDEDGEEVTFPASVPWTTIKEIMAAILARALLAHEAPKEHETCEGCMHEQNHKAYADGSWTCISYPECSPDADGLPHIRPNWIAHEAPKEGSGR
jgi:hypothetical protein